NHACAINDPSCRGPTGTVPETWPRSAAHAARRRVARYVHRQEELNQGASPKAEPSWLLRAGIRRRQRSRALAQLSLCELYPALERPRPCDPGAARGTAPYAADVAGSRGSAQFAIVQVRPLLVLRRIRGPSPVALVAAA